MDSDGTHEIFYLNDYAIMKRDNGGTFKLYFLCKDNLGSIVKAFDAEGDHVYSATYDVWGKQTITKNAIGLYRGYCGHEMLSDVDIINMNGRLYDPILGRFFSPDNYVQMPDNSQSFNRYSYCLNNPLKYKDPSGEIFGIDDFLFFSVVSGAMMGTMHAEMLGKSVWRGALSEGLSSLASYGVGSLFGHGLGTIGHELLRAGTHAVTSGTLNWINGDSFFSGAACGFTASLMGARAQIASQRRDMPSACFNTNTNVSTHRKHTRRTVPLVCSRSSSLVVRRAYTPSLIHKSLPLPVSFQFFVNFSFHSFISVRLIQQRCNFLEQLFIHPIKNFIFIVPKQDKI